MNEIYFYSASQNSFFPLSMKEDYEAADSWPDDGYEIAESLYESLMDGLANGKVLLPDESGYPALVEPTPPSEEELKAAFEEEKERLMRSATAAIAPLQDTVDMDIATDEESALLLEWKKYRVLLMRIDPTKAPDIDWPPKPE